MFKEAHFHIRGSGRSNIDDSASTVRLNLLVFFGIWFSTLEKPVRHSKRRIPEPRSNRMDCRGHSSDTLAIGSRISKTTHINYFVLLYPFQRDPSFRRLLRVAGGTKTNSGLTSRGAIGSQSQPRNRFYPREEAG
jgi:hypothetical protein